MPPAYAATAFLAYNSLTFLMRFRSVSSSLAIMSIIAAAAWVVSGNRFVMRDGEFLALNAPGYNKPLAVTDRQ